MQNPAQSTQIWKQRLVQEFFETNDNEEKVVRARGKVVKITRHHTMVDRLHSL
jgi:hypothetical protein